MKSGSEHNLFRGCGGLSGSCWYGIKRSAGQRRIKFFLSIEEAWGLYQQQNGKCALTGMPIVFAKTSAGRSNGETSASLDRKNSKLGYFLDNVQWVHKSVNRMKQGYDQKYFLSLCQQVYNHKIACDFEGTYHQPIRELAYENISLLPNKTFVNSRKECNTSLVLGKYKFAMPVYPANMPSVINEETCEYFASRNWFYTMHRFGVDQTSFIRNMHASGLLASISVGINRWSKEEIKQLYLSKMSPEFITVDVANAWSSKTEPVIKMIREYFPETFLIVGNVATAEAVREIDSWGANAVKVGIAGGAACTTKNKTGFYRPMVTALFECSDATKLPIIADGGIREHGDVAKALACGASAVMAGFLFSGYEESAGGKIEIEGKLYKEYYGSASERVKQVRKNIEGKEFLVPYKGPMGNLLTALKEDLQSSISYAGGFDLSAFRKSKIIEIE